MAQLPDSIRPYVTALVKYHFWILAALVPLIVLPLLFMTNAWLTAQMNAARSQIDSRFSALRSVQGQSPHPNENWSAEINARTSRIRRESLATWTAFWESQAGLRQWPASLGADFVQRAATLKPGGTLPRKLLERYQNGIRPVVRELPARMGADEAMRDANADEPGMAPREDPRRPGMRPAPRALVQWNAEDQRKLYESFNWEKAPSTAQIVLAQEELWVYGVLCDTIARVNKPAAGAYNAPIPYVEQMAVGYPAAEESPGGSGSSRILRPRATVGGGAVTDMEAMPAEGGPGSGPAGRPPHPRFGGGFDGGGAPGSMPPAPSEEGAGDVQAASPDDALRNWIYVDFSGKPLTAAELASSSATQMVHLMPFVLRVTIDERSLDALLVDLASSPIPIDVRQVRINADSSGTGQFDGGGAGGRRGRLPDAATGQTEGSAADRPRLHDISVELRGTVALATPPVPQVIGLEDAGAGEELAAEPGADEPPADEPVDEAAAPAEESRPAEGGDASVEGVAPVPPAGEGGS